MPGGWQIEDSIALAKLLKAEGVDLMDCSSGGVVPDAKITVKPGYQVPFAEKIRHGANIATAAVGYITEPKQADDIVRGGKADVVLARAADVGGPVLAGARRQGAGPQDHRRRTNTCGRGDSLTLPPGSRTRPFRLFIKAPVSSRCSTAANRRPCPCRNRSSGAGTGFRCSTRRISS